MKLFLYKFILFTFFASGIKLFPQVLILTQEEKEDIISYLDSTDYQGAMNTITEYKISEAREKIEQVFWDTKFSRLDQIRLLYLLSEFSSSYTQSYALTFIDTLNNIPSDYSGDDPSYLKARAAGILVQLGDNSKVNLFFDYTDEVDLNYSFTILDVLPVIMENVPEYELQAKNELIRIVNLSDFNLERISALEALYKKYGTEILPLLLQVFTEDEDYNNRQIVLDTLLACCNSSELHSLLKERLVSDPYFYIRYKIAGNLLSIYGTPEDYKIILEYLPNEQDTKVKEYTQQNLELFKPQGPDSSKTVIQLISELLILLDTTYTYDWIGNIDFINELSSYLQSSLSFWNNNDSINTAKEINSFQNKVDEEFIDSLDGDNKFVYLGAWKFLYWNAEYILDRLPEIPISAGISTYSVFATHSIWLQQNSDILSGSIGVNEAGEGPFLDSQVELSVGIGSTTTAGYTIKGNRINVKQNATVNADIYYNELTNNGTITGSLNTPLELPLIAALPEFQTSTPGIEDIVVPQNGEYTLTPGAYGEIQVKKNGKLIFTGGEYNIFKFNGGDNNQLLFQEASEVKIADKFDTGQGSYIGPEDTTTLSAKDIVFYVEGINGNNGNLGATPKAAKVGLSNTVKANFYVPNGTLWLRQNSEVEGAFIGKDVIVGLSVKVKLKSAY